jgi:hypothetical protein
MNQGGGAQRQISTPAMEMSLGESAQFAIEQAEQLVSRLGVGSISTGEQFSEIDLHAVLPPRLHDHSFSVPSVFAAAPQRF